jgi:hypothetical protein
VTKAPKRTNLNYRPLNFLVKPVKPLLDQSLELPSQDSSHTNKDIPLLKHSQDSSHTNKDIPLLKHYYGH